MDQSSFTDHWELSSLNQQQILTSHEDFQLAQYLSETRNLSNISPTDLNSMAIACSPMEASCKINCSERPRKIPKTISWSSSAPEQVPLNLVPKEEMPTGLMNSINDGLNWRYQMIHEQQGMKRSSSSQGLRPGHANDEHIIAERKRREKLSQRFIALASIIPGLKKADKASILGDAVKYVKELEQALKSLRDQKVKKAVESVVLLKKSNLSTDDNDCSVDGICSNANENSDGSPTGNLPPEIQVRISEKTVLVRIHCENQKGVLVKVLAEIEKLHLMVTNASVMPFAGSFLDITVTAETEEGYAMTARDLAKEISSIFHQLNW